MALDLTPVLRMSDEEFRLIRDSINRHCGLYFEDNLKYLLERRLARRVEQRLFKSFREYERFLRYDPSRRDELDEIVELLTTQETYFFRESYQFDALVEEVLPELVARKRAKRESHIRFWSAGCSSGEEPYSLAMILACQPQLAGFEWEVFASDISRSALQRARQAVYRSHSFRNGVPSECNRFFEEETGGNRRVREEIRRRVTFSALNLLDRDRLSLVRRLDVVFCRNVIIYFDTATKRQVIDLFHEKIEPGGFLFLGHSESLINLSTKFDLRHFRSDLVYQKAAKEGAAP
ncbi:MAG: protein-glutamate O-methyltransferase CheR [Bdellovibrionota bacterium]